MGRGGVKEREEGVRGAEGEREMSGKGEKCGR